MKSILACMTILFCSLILNVAGANQQVNGFHVPTQALQNPVSLMPSDKRLHLAVQLPIRDRAKLDQMLLGLYDPKSPDYHHYLTAQEFTQRFAPTQADYDKVVDFFKNKGFTVTTSPGRTLLDIDGTVKMVDSTFHIKLQLYKHPQEARNFYAPDINPSIDIGVPLSSVIGLDNYNTPRPIWGKHPIIKPLTNVKSGAN